MLFKDPNAATATVAATMMAAALPHIAETASANGADDFTTASEGIRLSTA